MISPQRDLRPCQTPLTAVETQVIEIFADGVRVLGLPRSLGEIYGLLFISQEPLSLDDLVEKLNISKGSTSQGLKTLRTLGAIRDTPRNGDRRTYYEPALELKRLVGGFIREQVRPHLISGSSKLQALSQAAKLSPDPSEREFFLSRIERLESWVKRGGKLLPLIQKILGQ